MYSVLRLYGDLEKYIWKKVKVELIIVKPFLLDVTVIITKPTLIVKLEQCVTYWYLLENYNIKITISWGLRHVSV